MAMHYGAAYAPKVENLALIAHAGAQGNDAVPARELCTSRWFVLARAYIESQGCPWYLLSAKYGLLSPSRIVNPYEVDLSNMRAAQRRAWAERVADQARNQLPYSERILVLAGMKYREFLMPHLAQITGSVYLPLDGLTVGLQCSWLRCNTPGPDGQRSEVP